MIYLKTKTKTNIMKPIKKLEQKLNHWKGYLALVVLGSGILAIGVIYFVAVYIPSEIGDLSLLMPKSHIVAIEVAKASNSADLSVREQVWGLLDQSNLTLDQKLKAMEIIKCESNFNPNALNKNTDGSYDLGIAMFNTKHHKEVTRQCAFDISCSINRMIEIVKQDNNFHQWACSSK